MHPRRVPVSFYGHGKLVLGVIDFERRQAPSSIEGVLGGDAVLVERDSVRFLTPIVPPVDVELDAVVLHGYPFSRSLRHSDPGDES